MKLAPIEFNPKKNNIMIIIELLLILMHKIKCLQ